MCELPGVGGTFVPILGSPLSNLQVTLRTHVQRVGRVGAHSPRGPRTPLWAPHAKHSWCGDSRVGRAACMRWVLTDLSVQVPSSVLARELDHWALASHACSQSLPQAVCPPGLPVATPAFVTLLAPHTEALSPPHSPLCPVGSMPPGWQRPCVSGSPTSMSLRHRRSRDRTCPLHRGAGLSPCQSPCCPGTKLVTCADSIKCPAGLADFPQARALEIPALVCVSPHVTS